MPDGELDELYCGKPSDFTALRGKLVTAAKHRGDTAAADRISAAHKPTTAAWVVNRLVLQRKETKQRLTDLGDRLRAAHANLDAERIRGLSKERHRLIDELTRAAFHIAGLNTPSAAVREDVANTLEAAIADVDVIDKLGRLAKAERWSGFAGFGAASAETSTGENHGELRAKLAAAERVKAAADKALSKQEQAVATARERYDEARRNLRDAQSALDAADKAYDRAKQATDDAADAVADIRAQQRKP